ncbi:MAG: OmpA family protein [Myxococcota bacterium]|nr:OmpA family protein [Myxococcota bacterium]
MKSEIIVASALIASIMGGCAATSRNTADPDRAAKQAEADKAAAQEAARKAQNDAAREQAEAQEAKRTQRTAEQQAQWASERAALAEAQAAHEAKTPAAATGHATGTTESQADTAAAIPSKLDVLFNVNSTDLSADAKAKLDQLAQSLKLQPQAHDVLVQGFTDDAGPESTNVQLSEKRAEVVVEYMTNRGVPRDRVASKSLGSQHPVNHDGTDRGRALNRRVEILIRPTAKH